MKNVILIISILMLVGMANLAAENLGKGSIEVYELGAVKMHVYQTNDMMNDFVIVLEKAGKTVMIEAPAFWDNFDEFNKYLTENNLNIDAIIPSYHPLGATLTEKEALKNSKTYLTQQTLDYWETGYGAVMKAGIPKIFGDKVDPTFYNPTELVKEGETEISGIKMIFNNAYDGFDIEIPEINTVYVHILGSDSHSEILSREHLNSSIKNFKKYLKKDYQTFLSSHHKPETKADMEIKLAYLKEMKKIVKQSKTGDKFVANMKSAFPTYKEGYLMASAAQLFADFERPARPKPEGDNMNKISRFPIPAVEDLPEDIQAMINGAKENMGFVPNVLSALTYRPEFLRAFMGFNNALNREGTGLTSIEREMMIVVFSSYKECAYCMASHGAGLSGETGDPELVKQLKKDYTKADITPRQKAVIEFGLKITKNAASVNESDFEILRSHGLSDADIFDAAGYAAFFNMSNMMMSVMKVMPDVQYILK